MNLFNTLLPYISTVVAVCVSISVLLVGRARMVGDIQDRVILAQKAENDTLASRVHMCEEKIDQLLSVLDTVIETLKEEGIFITYDGERVTIRDTRIPNAVRHIVKRTVKKAPAPKKPEEP